MSGQYKVTSGKLASQDMAGQVRLGQTESGHDNVRTSHVSSSSGLVRPGQSQVRSDYVSQ